MPAKQAAGEEVGAAVTPEEEFRALELAIVGAKVALIDGSLVMLCVGKDVGTIDEFDRLVDVGVISITVEFSDGSRVNRYEGMNDVLEIMVGEAEVRSFAADGNDVTFAVGSVVTFSVVMNEG